MDIHKIVKICECVEIGLGNYKKIIKISEATATEYLLFETLPKRRTKKSVITEKSEEESESSESLYLPHDDSICKLPDSPGGKNQWM